MNRLTVLLSRILLGLLILAACLSFMPSPLAAANAMVIDDDNNLREWGGDNYNQAPILAILNRGDYVRVWRKQGKWVEVSTPEGVHGWVNAQCLQDAPDTGQPQNISPALKERLGQFLQQLRAAAQSRNFQQLTALLAPGGLVLEGRVFKDADTDPKDQRPVVIPCFYASDVSLTMGTAWELLMTGTRPPPVKAAWDKAARAFKVAAADMGRESFPLEKQEPILPTHLAVLHLASVVRYVTGYPMKLAGFPDSENFRFDPYKTPFAWVFQVGPDRYLLMPFTRLGLYLVVTDRPGEGVRLKSVNYQTP
jgi:hypothetical protein